MPLDNNHNNTEKSQDKLIREACARGLPPWSSPYPEKVLPTSARVRIIAAIGAVLITGAIGAGVLYLIGIPL